MLRFEDLEFENGPPSFRATHSVRLTESRPTIQFLPWLAPDESEQPEHKDED